MLLCNLLFYKINTKSDDILIVDMMGKGLNIVER